MIPSLFIGSERADVIYWDFTDSLDVMMSYIPEICSYELLEAYLNIVDVLKQYLDKTIRIPMKKTLRSLNLSNSVAIVVYELLRQANFNDLEEISNYF